MTDIAECARWWHQSRNLDTKEFPSLARNTVLTVIQYVLVALSEDGATFNIPMPCYEHFTAWLQFCTACPNLLPAAENSQLLWSEPSKRFGRIAFLLPDQFDTVIARWYGPIPVDFKSFSKPCEKIGYFPGLIGFIDVLGKRQDNIRKLYYVLFYVPSFRLELSHFLRILRKYRKRRLVYVASVHDRQMHE